MHADPLLADRHYLLKHSSRQVAGIVTAILHKTGVNTLQELPVQRLELNEIGTVRVESRWLLFVDAYRDNRSTGGFILIDPLSNLTVGAGMITAP